MHLGNLTRIYQRVKFNLFVAYFILKNDCLGIQILLGYLRSKWQ